MDSTNSWIVLLVLNVLCPGLASYLNENSRSDVPELNPDDGGEIVHLVEVRVVVSWESVPGSVGERTHVLCISRSLSFTRQPDHT